MLLILSLLGLLTTQPKAAKIVVTRWSQDAKDCTVGTHERQGSAWHLGTETWDNFGPPQGQITLLAGSGSDIALTGTRNGAGVIRLNTVRKQFYLDRPRELYGMKFGYGGQVLLLMTHPNRSVGKPSAFSVDVITVSSGKVVKELAGWFATCSGSEVLLQTDFGPRVYDYSLDRFVSDRALEGRFKQLLKARERLSGVDTGQYHPFNNRLPDTLTDENFGYCISPDARYMTQFSSVILGPPKGQSEEVDGGNDYVKDLVFSSSASVMWQIKRGSSQAVSGFHFVNASGDFMFAMRWPFWMGKNSLVSYGPGIYTVESTSGRVHKTSLPEDVTNIDMPRWFITELVSGY